MARKKDPVEYDVNVRLNGLPAYFVKKLVEEGFYGNTEEEVVRVLIAHGIESRLEVFEKLGMTCEEARERGYVPIKPDSEGD